MLVLLLDAGGEGGDDQRQGDGDDQPKAQPARRWV